MRRLVGAELLAPVPLEPDAAFCAAATNSTCWPSRRAARAAVAATGVPCAPLTTTAVAIAEATRSAAKAGHERRISRSEPIALYGVGVAHWPQNAAPRA
jgi:hypothetical protein